MKRIKDYLPRGLYWRTFLIVAVPVLLLQITVSIVFFDRHWSKMTERLATAVSGEIAAILYQIETYPDVPGKIDLLSSLAARHLSLQIIRDETAEEFPARRGRSNDGVTRDLDEAMGRILDAPYAIASYPDDKLVIVDIKMPGGGIVTVTIPEGRLYSSSSYIFILWMIGLSIVLFSVALLFMRNQIRPIHKLGLIAERLGRGIPVGRFKPTGAREVRQAGEAFIRMQDRINQFVDQRTTMLAGVSHDLKTPLTRMKLQLEMLGDTPDTEAMKGDIADMERMIEGYLSFVRGDGGETASRIEIAPFFERLCDTARRLSLNVDCDIGGAEGKTLWAKPQALERAFTNFIGNSARYARHLTLKVSVGDAWLVVTLDDDGPGVRPDQLGHILKPFVRGEASRNMKTGGAGLGLTIANDIIVSHAGTLDLGRSETMGGLRVTVTLPI